MRTVNNNHKMYDSWNIIILHMRTINADHIMYVSRNMEHNGQLTFCHYVPFLALYPPPPPLPLIILHKSTKNHDHMPYCSWDTGREGCNFYYSFWTIVCPFTPLTAGKIKILKRWKRRLDVSFYTCNKIMIAWCVRYGAQWTKGHIRWMDRRQTKKGP